MKTRSAVTFLLALAAISLLVYFPSLRCSFAYDDIDQLNSSADLLAGRVPFWQTLLTSHNGHLLPIFRLAMTASAALFGTNAMPLRILILAAHVLSAFFLG